MCVCVCVVVCMWLCLYIYIYIYKTNSKRPEEDNEGRESGHGTITHGPNSQ